MTHELTSLFAAGVTYLLALFLVAYAADRREISDRLVRHPLTFTLSLGVYATSWSYYGSVGFAASHGYQFLTIYLGVTIAFALTPVLLQPLLQLTREYQLSSLADLFAFRYRSHLAGVLVTVFMLVGALPYIALQIRAVTESLRVLTDEAPPNILALGFCVTLILFAVLFGARHVSPREKHRGLVVAIAFESLVKFLTLFMMGGFALFEVFHGPAGLNTWLDEHPEAIEALYAPVREGPWLYLLFLAFCASFLLPRQFHMMFAENINPRALSVAMWAFPLFLLLLNLPIPIILWAGQHMHLDVNPDYYVLGIALQQNSPWLPILTFVGGVSAASAMVIVTTLALASMCLNHLLLPASYPTPRVNIYRWLLWGRRLLITLIIAAGYGFYAMLEHQQGLVQLGLISFVAVAQFLPGIVGVLYWRQATRSGLIAGLAGGITIWAWSLLVPLLHGSGFLPSDLGVTAMHELSGMDRWSFSTFWSMLANGLLYASVSVITRQSDGEQQAARACCAKSTLPLVGVVAARSPLEFQQGLSEILGHGAAQREVQQALDDLGLSASETRAPALRRLRERIERNLSGLMGPQLAHAIVNQQLALDDQARTALADSMRFFEERLEKSRSQLDGLTAQLDNMRRYHREILLELPIGVCAISHEHEVVVWNRALEVSSRVVAGEAIGVPLSRLPSPWNEVLNGFARASDSYIHHMEIMLDGRPHWFNLHKAVINEPGMYRRDALPGQVILLEDLTHMENLEAELAHSDRLASIGRLAAGVAHEIGNPVTGIASLAQNLQHEDNPAIIEQSIADILTQTKRITSIVQSLMRFSRSGAPAPQLQPVSLREVLSDAHQLVTLTHKHKQVEFAISCPDPLRAIGDQQQLVQVFVNLFTNASDASQPGDRVDIIARADGEKVSIEVMDRGCGIPPQVQDRLFEPFVTTKAAGEGTGLGLALTYKIIQEHEGDILIDSEEGVGTRVRVELPLATDTRNTQTSFNLAGTQS